MTITKQLNIITIVIISVIIGMFILIATHDINNIEKVVYCKIDSVLFTVPKYEIMPELITKYHTDCNSIFSSNKAYNIGDSIMVKTIIVQ